jgi:dTDP-4-amino-4,6-dideoxy-D-glucose transaminase
LTQSALRDKALASLTKPEFLNIPVRDAIAALGGPPIFQQPLHIVRPTFPDVHSFLAPLQTALASGQVTNNGRWVVEFERQLSEYLGVPTLAFCNGQMALMAMLRAAGIDGGEVIVPSFTFSATPHAVRWCGAEPVFADIAADGSMCIDPEDVERRITPRTVAILGVDSYGIACDYEALHEIGRRRGLKVVFDSAPSFGTRVGGRLVGGYGDAQMFSFHATKAFTTMEGGCLCTHDQEIFERAKAIRNFGQGADADCSEAGFNAKLTEICALIGIEQLKTFEDSAATRRRAIERMREGLGRVPGLTIACAPSGQDPIWLYMPVLIDQREFGLDRNALAAALEKENLFVRKYYSPPCHHLTAYSSVNGQTLPRTEASAYSVVALPVYNDMTAVECDGISQAFAEIQCATPRLARAAF